MPVLCFELFRLCRKREVPYRNVIAVTPHVSSANTDSSNPSYEVSVKVGNTVYVVLYTPPLGMGTAKYVAGRQVLVLVREKTIVYNDISGNPIEVPIISRKTVAAAGGSN